MKTFSRTITIEGRDIPFELNRLSLRKKRELQAIIELLSKKDVSISGTERFDNIERGFEICVCSWDGGRPIPEISDEIIEYVDVMKLFGEAMRGNQITEDERKKSE